MRQTMRERVNQRMAELGLKPKQLADKIDGMSLSALSQFLNGHTKTLVAENIVDIAIALETTAEWLVRGTYPSRPPREPPAHRIAEEPAPRGGAQLRGNTEANRRLAAAWNDLVEFQQTDLVKRAEEHASLNREIRAQHKTGT